MILFSTLTSSLISFNNIKRKRLFDATYVFSYSYLQNIWNSWSSVKTANTTRQCVGPAIDRAVCIGLWKLQNSLHKTMTKGIIAFLYVAPYSLVHIYKMFEKAYFLHLQCRREFCMVKWSMMKAREDEVKSWEETNESDVYQTTRRHFQEESNHYTHRLQNLKFHMIRNKYFWITNLNLTKTNKSSIHLPVHKLNYVISGFHQWPCGLR
jgi:hypothetical protein